MNVMKKLFSLSVLSLALLSGNALAGNGEIRFIGAVTDVTCNLVPSVGGSVNNTIQLGTASLTTPATAVDFSLKSDMAADCSALQDDDVVSIAFMGPLNDAGLANQSGLATDAIVEIKSVNATAAADNTVVIKQGSDKRAFKGSLFSTAGAAGAQFTAQLVGKTEQGDYQSALAFAVSYL